MRFQKKSLNISAQGAAMSSINFISPTVKEIKDKLSKSGGLFNVVSFFAGGGGSSTGYRIAGGNILLVNEFIDEAVATYKANWPDTQIINRDIRDIKSSEVLNRINMKEGEVDIIDGSPPCSAFSTSGSREKGWGKRKKYSDKSQENIQDLFFDYIRMVNEIKPKVFIAENVKGLAIGNAKGYLNIILRELKSCGYNVEARIIDASRLDVPQTRNRLIIIGIRNDLYKNKYKGRFHPEKKPYIIPVIKCFSGLEFTEKDRIDTDISEYKVYEKLVNLKSGCADIKRFNLVKADPLKPCPCITATSGCNSAAAARHWDNRSFTVSEVKRIMTLPDDYILTGSFKQKIERMGRMVPPLMMKNIAENIFKLGVLNGDS